MIMKFGKTVIKNLFSKPVTTAYPAQPAQFQERTRGHIEINMESCVFCGLCGKNCPSQAIVVNRAEQTWGISRFDCVQCGYCVTLCRKNALAIVPGYPEPKFEKTIAVFQKEPASI